MRAADGAGERRRARRAALSKPSAPAQNTTQKRQPESANCLTSAPISWFLPVLTQLTPKNHVNHSHSAKYTALLCPHDACARRLRPTATATAPTADDPTDTPPRRDPHDLLARRSAIRRSAIPFPVDQPHKQAREPLGHDARRRDEPTPSHTQLTGSQDRGTKY